MMRRSSRRIEHSPGEPTHGKRGGTFPLHESFFSFLLGGVQWNQGATALVGCLVEAMITDSSVCQIFPFWEFFTAIVEHMHESVKKRIYMAIPVILAQEVAP